MFSIEYIVSAKDSETHFHIYNSKLSAKIYPNLGASIQELIINNTPIFYNCSGDDTIYLQGYYNALLFPFTGRVEDGRYKHQQKEFQLDLNDAQHHNALHGLVYDKAFKCISTEVSATHAAITFEYLSSGNSHGFPFKFRLQAYYIFSEEGMQLHMKIENLDDMSFPFQLGWHPYFMSKNINQNTIEIHSNKAYTTNKRLIPTEPKSFNPESIQPIGAQHLDTSYQLAAPFVHYKSHDYELTLELKHQDHHFLQLYTPEDRKSISVEPMTALPNAFNNGQGLQILQPNNSYQCQWHLNIKTYD
jgi:aldose 1-epimerase